jgi:hypothetical protein
MVMMVVVMVMVMVVVMMVVFIAPALLQPAFSTALHL